MKSIGAVLQRTLDVIGKICEAICIFLALAMIFLVTLQVILRTLNMPLFGIEELLTFPTIWIYFLGGVCASYTDSHIECSIVGALSKNKKAIVLAKQLSNIAASFLAIYVLKWGAEYTQYSLKMHKVSAVLKIPMPIGEVIIMVGLTLMAVFTVVRTVQGIINLKTTLNGGKNQ